MIVPYPHHPYANVFPLRDGESLTELADHIRAKGQKERIVLFEGQVLAGRRRQLACIRYNIRPLYREFGSRPEDGEDPLEFAFTDFYRRDDITQTEKAIAANKYANLKKGDNQHTGKKKEVGTADPTSAPIGQKEAAKKFGVPVKQLKRAKSVIEKGCPELIQAMEAEAVTIRDAAAIAGEPPEVQKAAVEAVATGEAKTLAAAVKEANPDPDKDRARIVKDIRGVIERLTAFVTKDKAVKASALKGLTLAAELVGKL